MANNLKSIRTSQGLSQQKAAERMGTTRNQLAKLEKGTRRLSDLWIAKAAKAYGVDSGKIVTDEPLVDDDCERFSVSIERESAAGLLSDLIASLYGEDRQTADEHSELALALLEEFAAGESAETGAAHRKPDRVRAVARFLSKRRRPRTGRGNSDS